MVRFWDKLGDGVQTSKGFLTIGLVDISTSVATALFWIIIARSLGSEQYGYMSYFFTIAGIGSTVSLIGSENTLMVYTAKNVKIQSTIFLLALIASCIVGGIIYFLFHNFSTSFLVIGYVILGLSISEILGRKLYKTYSKYMILQKILMFTLVASFYGLGVNGIIFGLALSYTPFLIIISKEFRQTKTNFPLLKTKLRFLIDSYVLSLVGITIRSSDRLIVSSVFGYSMLGNYQVAIQIIDMLQLLPTILLKYTLPNDSTGLTSKILKRISIYFAIGVVAGTFFLSPLILPTLFPKFTNVMEIVQISSLVLIPASISSIYTSKLLGNERSKIVLIGLIISLVIQTLSILILGSIFGMKGVAISLVLAAIGQATYLTVMEKITKLD